MGRAGFEPAKSKDNGVTVRPIWPLWNLPSLLNQYFQEHPLIQEVFLRADGGTRTHDLLITNQLL